MNGPEVRAQRHDEGSQYEVIDWKGFVAPPSDSQYEVIGFSIH